MSDIEMNMFQTFIKSLKVLLLVYVCLVIALYFKQRSLIYFPSWKRPVAPKIAEIATVTTEDGLELQGWYFAAHNKNFPTLIYFHGNAIGIAAHLVKINEYLAAGYGVLLTEYRGYSGNPGKPSEQGLYKDARAYLNWLKEEKNIPVSQIVIYGESIGSGVALEMIKEFDERGDYPYALVLEAPFVSLLQMAKRRYFFVPVDWLLLDRFMNIEKMSHVKVPLLVVNGQLDELIPNTDGQILYNMAKEPKTYVMIPAGDHNGLHLHGLQKYVLDFLAGIRLRDLDNTESGISQE
ncbi:MAG: alpha/beta hydrolase [Alphaproteobacteria bacterium]|nr:alpha/beta hydrolase [Alphaproteobacteria bacterium]